MGKKRKKTTEPVKSQPEHAAALRIALMGIGLVFVAISVAVLIKLGVISIFPSRIVPPENLVLVTLDTLRADHLGCYGYREPTSPTIDRLAASGVLFEQAQSTAPLTLPSHSTILTGLYPFRHGVRNNGDFYLPPSVPTLATHFKQHGAATAAFVSAFVLDSRYGLDQGFDFYEDRMERKDMALQDFEVERKGGETMRASVDWLRANANGPFFMWVHLYDPHESYDPPEPYRSRFASRYDGEIAYTDSLVGELVGALDELGVRSRTLLALVADHGESLGEHGEESHSIFIYNATMHVPVILNMPGGLPEGTRVSAPVSIADIYSTFVELFGFEAAAGTDGRTLLPLIKRPSGDRTGDIYIESQFPKLYLRWAPLVGLRSGPWKYIEAPRPELYRVDVDPAEANNLATSNPEMAASMRERLRELLPEGDEDRFNRQALDDETIAKLAGLGYVGAAAYAGAAEADPSTLADPKDKIAFFNTLRDAQKEIRLKRFDTAVPMLERVARDEPDNAVALLFLASGYLGMERYDSAIAMYRRYLDLIPTSAYAHHWIAIAAVRNGDPKTALAEEEAALSIDSRFVDSYVMKAGLLANAGRYDEAVGSLQSAIAIDPDNTALRNDLGAVYMEWRKLAEAEAIYKEIVSRDAEYAPAYTSLGIISAARGDSTRAIEYFRKALAIAPAQSEARINLVRALVESDRHDEAKTEIAVILRQTEGTTNARMLAIRQAAIEAARLLDGSDGLADRLK